MFSSLNNNHGPKQVKKDGKNAKTTSKASKEKEELDGEGNNDRRLVYVTAFGRLL